MGYSGLDVDGRRAVSRRILKGMGLSWRDLPAAMSGSGLRPSGDVLSDSMSLLCLSSGGALSLEDSPVRGDFTLSASATDRSHFAVRDNPDAVALASLSGRGAVILCPAPVPGRVPLSWAYILVGDGMAPPWVEEPPAVLLCRSGQFNAWYRETADLVSSLLSRPGCGLPSGTRSRNRL